MLEKRRAWCKVMSISQKNKERKRKERVGIIRKTNLREARRRKSIIKVAGLA